jgi:3-deoxy-D-manno-octulosonic-acid transferase
VGSGAPALAPDLASALGKVPLFVAGSTHTGEERAALDALAAIEQADLEAALVLAPRRLGRVEEVLRLAQASGRPVRRRTALGAGPLAAGEVLVVDTLGELAGLLAHADVAFVGGTLVTVGGHNILEPVLGRRPVLYGPHTANVRHAVEILEACGAGRRVADARELGALATAWLADPAATRARGEAGFQALGRHRGSARRAADLVERVLGAAES